MTTYTVFPMRFSAQPHAMIALLDTLGLHKELDSADGGYAVFAGASGRVAVHGTETAASGARSGDTSLNLGVADVHVAADELAAAGLETAVWDETYGKQGGVKTPIGQGVWLTEDTQADLYGGYRVHEQVTAASLDVVAVYYSTDFARDAAFFARFGFEPYTSLDDPWWCALRAGAGQGVIGLHHTETEREPGYAAPDDPIGPPGRIGLGFETSEPLDALAARLRAAGYESANVVEDEAGPHLELTDPDGQHLEIHLTS